MDATTKILILTGSLRRDSYNRALARRRTLAPSGVSTVTFDGLGALPFYDGDLEQRFSRDRRCPAARDRRGRRAAGRDPPVQRRHEWCPQERPGLGLPRTRQDPGRKEPIAVMGASTGGSGAKGGIESVGRILGRTHSDVLDHVVAVPFAARRSTTTWPWWIAEISAEVAGLVTELAHRARSTGALAA